MGPLVISKVGTGTEGEVGVLVEATGVQVGSGVLVAPGGSVGAVVLAGVVVAGTVSVGGATVAGVLLGVVVGVVVGVMVDAVVDVAVLVGVFVCGRSVGDGTGTVNVGVAVGGG